MTGHTSGSEGGGGGIATSGSEAGVTFMAGPTLADGTLLGSAP